MPAMEDLVRVCQPRDATPLRDALEGRASSYDVDGQWASHYMGWPRGTPGSFDGEAFLNAVIAIPFLASRLPVGDPLLAAAPSLDAKVRARLANERLLLFGGSPTLTERDEEATARSDGAWVVERSYVSFTPVRVVEERQRLFLRTASERSRPNDTWPWSSLYPAFEAFSAPGYRALVSRLTATPVAPGRFEIDPLASAPQLVEIVRSTLQLDADAARFFLQVLTLVDCSDALVCEVNGWKKPFLTAVGSRLKQRGLVTDEKRARSQRTFTLPGPWDAYKPPHPAIERWKLELYEARVDEKLLEAPLGRLLPLRPLHELFEQAWARWNANRPAAAKVESEARWLDAIRAAPADDHPREVYADWLEERGEPLGRFIRVQCAIAREPTATLEAEQRALLEAHETKWLEPIHAFIERATWKRGFVTEIEAHAATFAKGATAVFAAQPMLEGFIFSGSISPAQVRALAACPEFSRFTSLDTGGTNYFARLELLEALLASPHLPRLRRLVLAFHRPGEGLGLPLCEAIAKCERLRELEVLELQGQNVARSIGEDFRPIRHGIEGLARLLKVLPALRVLRVPYNGFTDVDARDLARQLSGGLAPKLEVLDLSNTIAETFVTKAVSWNRNTVKEGQHTLDTVLAKRRGLEAPQPPVEVSRPPLDQKGRFPFAELAKSGTSRCVVCRERIELRSVRIGIERELPAVGRITAWLHPACRTQCPELAALPDCDERLAKNSPKVWPVGEPKSPAFWRVMASQR